MADQLEVAVIGAGYFSQFHYEAWSRLPQARITALTALDGNSARETAARFGVPAVYESAERLLKATRPDVVDIVTPPQTHKDLVELVARHGIQMVCQKPLADTLEDAREVVEIAERANVPLIVHENFRFQPWYRHAKSLLEEGRLGTPHSISFRMRPGDGQGPEAYLDRQPYFQEMKRFFIHETGIHFVDTFRFLLGEVIAVTARLRRINPAIAGEDAGYVIFEFENGATAVLDGNRLNDHSAANCRLTMGEMHLEGANGVLRLDGDGGLWLKPHGASERKESYAWENIGFAGDCVFEQIRHIAEHLQTGAPVVNSGRDYLRNVEIEEAIYRSNESGRRIALA